MTQQNIPCDGIMFNPPHPGLALKTLYMAPLGLTVTAMADRLGVERKAVSRLINGHTGVTAEMALRLGKALGTTPALWLNKQSGYDLWQAGQRMKKEIRWIKPITPTDYQPGA